MHLIVARNCKVLYTCVCANIHVGYNIYIQQLLFLHKEQNNYSFKFILSLIISPRELLSCQKDDTQTSLLINNTGVMKWGRFALFAHWPYSGRPGASFQDATGHDRSTESPKLEVFLHGRLAGASSQAADSLCLSMTLDIFDENRILIFESKSLLQTNRVLVLKDALDNLQLSKS